MPILVGSQWLPTLTLLPQSLSQSQPIGPFETLLQPTRRQNQNVAHYEARGAVAQRLTTKLSKTHQKTYLYNKTSNYLKEIRHAKANKTNNNCKVLDCIRWQPRSPRVSATLSPSLWSYWIKTPQSYREEKSRTMGHQEPTRKVFLYIQHFWEGDPSVSRSLLLMAQQEMTRFIQKQERWTG